MEEESLITREYLAKTATSRVLYQRAQQVFPSGVTHDGRYLRPYPIFVSRASGSRKWDVDGNELVDYFGGHGSLILGHNHPVVVEAVRKQLSKGTHYGASHELELEWAEQIKEMVPCAEKVRFTGSGTEASLLALRVARAFTNRNKILRFKSHFHGWHDQVAFASTSHFDGSIPAGITDETVGSVILCPPNDLKAAQQLLEGRDDVAAVIIEPTGSAFGQVPTGGDFLMRLRELTEKHRVLLIFDEVISGFRCAPGGAQGYYGVTPDLALLAKIMAGGYPGGALVGRVDVMDVLTVRNDPKWDHECRVPHQGTFNANPISASAGLATLRLIASTEVTQKANHNGEMLRSALNQVVKEEGVNWPVYGRFSSFHIFVNQENRAVNPSDIHAGKVPYSLLKGATPPSVMSKIRTGMLLEGVDLMPWPGGMISAVHSESDIEKTATALRQLLTRFKKEGQLV